MRLRRKLTLCTLSLAVGLLFFPLAGAASATTESDDDMHWSIPIDLPDDMHWFLHGLPDDMHW